jgi:nucleoside-diphosphate-sugar epimerase
MAARTDCDEHETLAGYKANTEGTQNVLDAVAAAGSVSRLVVTSTQFVCRPGYAPRHDEDYNPHTVYGRSKVVCEQLTRQAKLDCVWTLVRPTTIWGPWLFRHRRSLFPLLRRGLYVHPGRKPCIRSWGYVGNVVYQVRRLLEAPAQRVDRKTYYLGDRPLNLLDWVNAFSLRLRGRPVRVVPRGVVYLLGLAGDVAALAGLHAPITTSRYRSMTQDYITPMEPTFELTGEPPFALDDGVEQVVRWLEQPCRGAAKGDSPDFRVAQMGQSPVIASHDTAESPNG